MCQNEKTYQSECTHCGDRNMRRVQSWIEGLTHHTSFNRTYLVAQEVKHIFKQIQDEAVTGCHCMCALCSHCDTKEETE